MKIFSFFTSTLKIAGVKIRNTNIEIPAFAGAASRRQAKQILNPNFKV